MSRYLPTKDFRELNLGIRDVIPGFGTGNWRVFGASTSWTVPSGVAQVRVTAIGGGGSSGQSLYGYYNNNGPIPSCTPDSTACGPVTIITPGGGGGGGYIVATVNVTAGCSCCIVVGAGGGAWSTYCGQSQCWCIGTCCILCGTNGGCSKFGTAVCALGGEAGKTFSCCCALGSCLGRGGAGGGAAANTSVATTLACYCGNAGCCGGFSCYCSCIGRGICCDLTGAPGGASGSPIGGGGTGPFPGTLLTDVYNCRSFAGGAYDEDCIVSKYTGAVNRWPGESIISTYYGVGCGCQVAGTAVCGPNGFRVTMYGGSVPCGQTLCLCCNAACTMSNLTCRACPSAYYAAGCGGGGSSFYFTCYCNSCFTDPDYCYQMGCRRCGTIESGNGIVIVEW